MTHALTTWFQEHRRSLLFLLTSFGLAGIASVWFVPVSLFPLVQFPRIVVSLDAGDRPADRTAVEVTRPIEEGLRAIPGVLSVRSTTSRGAADVSVNFHWGQDMISAMLQVESAVTRALPSLPAGTTFEVRSMDPTVFPVLGFSLTSDTRSLVELRDVALYQLRPVLSTVRGVSSIGVLGGGVAEYHVLIDPPRLDALNVSIDDVASTLSAASVITAVGRVEDHSHLYLVIGDTQFKSAEEIAATPIRGGAGGIVRVSDVAKVVPGVAPQWTRVTADGHDAVIAQVFQQPSGNTVEIANGINAKLADLQRILPKDVRIARWYDQSQLILSSSSTVRDAVIAGVVLAGLVLLVFLRNFRVTLIASITVPLVLAVTVLILHALGLSFNIMTLGGMAAAVGLIVDDAIVMIEHVIRRLREGEGSHGAIVLAAAAEFTRPLAGSSACTVVIFAPLAFLSGVTGAFFKALALTMAASLAVSFLVAWIAVPLLSVRVLRQQDMVERAPGAIRRRVDAVYAATLGTLVRRPYLAFAAMLPIAVAGWFAYRHVGSGFMPSMDEGGFVLDYRAPSGMSLTETDRLLREVESILRATPEVATYSRRTGLQLGGGLTEANAGDFFVELRPLPRRPIDDIMNGVRRRIEKDVPGLEIEMALLMEDLIGDLTAVPQPIEIKLYSDDLAQLRLLAPRLAKDISSIPGVVDVKSGIVLAGDAVSIRVDREKAALEGVTPDSITRTVESLIEGNVTGQIQRGPKMVAVRSWLPAPARSRIEQIESLRLRAPDGHLFPLKRVASLSVITGQPEITREDLKQMVAVTGRISGRDLGSTIRDVRARLDRPGALPNGIYYALGGLYQQQQIAFRGLLAVLGAAILLVYLLLLFLYESFRVATAMLVTTSFALAFVFVGLWVTGTELNISAMMGMTMVVGIVTEVSIFYYSEYASLPLATDRAHRFIAAGQNRMRPIAMTTLAAILALSPLALGVGQGSAMQQPLAIAIISGLAGQFFLALLVLPVLLAVFGGPHD